MTVLGAVLAGGRSRRFGSDKAVAMLDGRTLIEHVVARLGAQVDAVVVVGRDGGIADRPGPDLGPLGGLNAALHYAASEGLDAVVTLPCDAPWVPDDLVVRLGGGGARFCAAMPVIGWWPAALADRLDAHLAAGDDRSMRAWTRAIGAVAVDLGAIPNVNTADDLARLSARSTATPPRSPTPATSASSAAARPADARPS